MKNKIISLALISAMVLLAGCANNHIWVGENPEKDYYECQAAANTTYPPIMATNKIGSGYSSPINTTCSNYGGITNCSSTGGNYTPPQEISIDVNSNKRLAHFGYCMTQKGNKFVAQDEYISQTRSNIAIIGNNNCKDKYSLFYNPAICEKK